MQTIWLLTVSFCLFNKKVIAASSSSENSNSEELHTAVCDRRTLLKPYLSKYDELYKTYGRQFTGRHILSAKAKSPLIKPLTYENWMDIDNLANTSGINDDNVNQNDEVTYAIYVNVKYLLLEKIHYWTSANRSTRSILYYLGYEEETVDVINMAMTELLSLHRKRKIKIDSLTQLFYYSCDVENMVRNINAAWHTATVKQIFTYFLSKFSYTSNFDSNRIIENEREFVNNIKSNLQLIVEKTNASFSITISSMKLSILRYDTNNELINSIKNRIVSPTFEMTCGNLVWLYSHIDESNKINAYHSQILGFVATQVFGYIYNHFELLIKLRRYPLEEDDQQIIENFKTFVSAYTSVFIDRYFEFSGKVNQRLVDALFRLMYFLDPYNMQTPNVIGLTGEEAVFLNEFELQTYSIYDYFNPQFDMRDSLLTNMWSLISNAVRVLIVTFTDESFENWNQLTRIAYTCEDDKNTLLEYMNNNNRNAIKILDIFAKELTIDHLYKKYNLNGPF